MSKELNREEPNKGVEVTEKNLDKTVAGEGGLVGSEMPWDDGSGIRNIYVRWGNHSDWVWSPYYFANDYYYYNNGSRCSTYISMTGKLNDDFKLANSYFKIERAQYSNDYVWHHVFWYPGYSWTLCKDPYPYTYTYYYMNATDWESLWRTKNQNKECLMQLVEKDLHNKKRGSEEMGHVGAAAQHRLLHGGYRTTFKNKGTRNSDSAEEYLLNFPDRSPESLILPDQSSEYRGGIYVPEETDEHIEALRDKFKFSTWTTDLLKYIYKNGDSGIRKLKYYGEAEGMILASVYPCFSKSDKPGEGYMSIDRLYSAQIDVPKSKRIIQDNYLPFATDGFGNDFYLDLNSPTGCKNIYYGDQMVFFDEPDPIRFFEFDSEYKTESLADLANN
ncbi:MAG: SMI1/KNR4 family protein [Candidatus Ancillula sp.]|nr:SMI1/KNR4 family protein [Candidatus Ancillula sp.]